MTGGSSSGRLLHCHTRTTAGGWVERTAVGLALLRDIPEVRGRERGGALLHDGVFASRFGLLDLLHDPVVLLELLTAFACGPTPKGSGGRGEAVRLPNLPVACRATS